MDMRFLTFDIIKQEQLRYDTEGLIKLRLSTLNINGVKQEDITTYTRNVFFKFHTQA